MGITERIERKARRYGVEIKRALQVAGIHRSTWFRWKAGGGAQVAKVQLVESAIDSLRIK